MQQESIKLSRVFYLLIAARLSATFGMYLNILVINIFILELTGSAAWVGALAAIRILSGMISSPCIGQLTDRIGRKKLMVACDFALAFFILGTAFAPAQYIKEYLLFLMLAVGVLSSAVDIVLSAAVPAILHSHNTIKANAVLMSGRNIVIGLSGLSVVFIKDLFSGYNTVFIINAAAYLLAGFIVLFLDIQMEESGISFKTAKTEAKEKSFIKNFLSDYKDVFVLPNFRVLILMFIILGLDGLASGSHNIGWPLFSQAQKPENPFFIYGLLDTFWAFGNVIGIFWLAKSSLVKKLKPENLYLVCTAIMSFGMIMTVQSSWLWLILSASCVAGFGDGAYQTFFNTYLQTAPDNVRGKLFGLSSMFLRTGFGISFIIMPFFMGFFPVNYVLLFSHGPLIIVSLLFLIVFNTKPKNKFVF
jgi:MFS family permease